MREKREREREREREEREREREREREYRSHDDHAVYCSFLETNFVYLWGGYVLQGKRCGKI